MKKIVCIAFLFSLLTQAQNRYIYDFEAMPVVPMINSELEELQRNADLVIDANLFYTDNCLTDGVICSAIGYRKGKDWKVYATPFGTNWRARASFAGYSDDRNYAFFEGGYWANGNGHEVESTEFYIVDLVNGSCTGFSKDEYIHSWTYPVGDSEEIITDSFSSVKTQIVVDGKRFTLMQSDFSYGEAETTEDELSKLYGNYDADSGIYEIQGQKLVKTFYYDSATMRMRPIKFAGSLAKGMVLRNIVDVYSPYEAALELKQVPKYTYGDDSDEIGYEVWFQEELQYFLIVLDLYADVKRITGLTVISPEIEVGGLHTGMEIGAILKRFPDAKLNIDLINDWEYLYIKELGLRLTFKTDEHNRVAKYSYNKKTGDHEVVKITDKKRKLDLITID